MTDLASQERHKRINLTDKCPADEGQAGHCGWLSPTEPAGGATGMLVTAVDVVDEAMTMPCWRQPKRRPGRKCRRRWPTPDISRESLGRIASRGQQVVVSESLKDPYHKDQFTNMTSRASFRAHRDRRSTLFVSSMRMESRCVCTGLWCRLSGVSSLRRQESRSLAIGPHDAVLIAPGWPPELKRLQAQT